MAHLRVVGLDHIVLWSPDVERSVAFYRDVLGCAIERYDEWREGKAFFPSVRLSDTTIIDIFGGGAEGVGQLQPRNLNHFCLRIEAQDMAALRDALIAAGVPVPGDPVIRWGARGDGTSIYIQDPDGNDIELKSY